LHSGKGRKKPLQLLHTGRLGTDKAGGGLQTSFGRVHSVHPKNKKEKYIKKDRWRWRQKGWRREIKRW
jgi:hypothetical protein